MAEAKKMITLISLEKESFQIDESAAKLSKTIANMIEEGVTVDDGIPISTVNGATLAKIIEYCNKHTEKSDKMKDETEESDETKYEADEKDNLDKWDKEFVGTEFHMLFAIILAANFLDIKSLLGTACQTVADLIKSKSVEEIRQIFNVENDYTPEEEAEVRRENAWAFE